jgi:hypothetical protein
MVSEFWEAEFDEMVRSWEEFCKEIREVENSEKI